MNPISNGNDGSPEPVRKVHRGAQELAGLYDSNKRYLEYAALSVGFSTILANGYFILKYATKKVLPQASLVVVSSMISADFLSGLAHWIADTWGSVDIPFIGPYFLSPFREHHIDPTAMTNHDFVQTNSYNFLAIIPFEINMLYKFITSSSKTIMLNYNWNLYVYVLGIFVSLTNQIHKWSHTHSELPKLIALLQRYHIILPQKHHHYHHIAPHETYYCITTGWLNYPLEKIRFWATLEKIITKLTGVEPRTDDFRWANRN